MLLADDEQRVCYAAAALPPPRAPYNTRIYCERCCATALTALFRQGWAAAVAQVNEDG